MVRSINEGGQDGCWLKELELVEIVGGDIG